MAILMVFAMMPMMAWTVYADEGMTWPSLKSALEAGGTVTLTSDVTRDSYDAIEISGNTVLDLDGHKLDAGGYTYNNNLFIISEGGTLTIRDGNADKNGLITGLWNYRAASVNGELLLESGSIDSGGVNVYDSGSFTMTGGSISEFGVNIYDGSFTMTGGSITNCDSGVNGSSGSGSFTMTGGSITNCNTGVNGSSGSGSFTMTGGSITNCNTGVDIGTTVEFAVGGDTIISGNTEMDVRLYWYVFEDEEKIRPFKIIEPLSEKASIGVWTDKESSDDEKMVFTSGLRGKGSRNNFFSNNGYYLAYDGAGEAALSIEQPQSHSITVEGDDAEVTLSPQNPLANETVLVNISPNEGYDIAGVRVLDPYLTSISQYDVIWEGDNYSSWFIMPDEDVTISVKVDEISCDPHNWEQKVQKATTDVDGRIYQICSVCGQEETIAPLLKVSNISLAGTSFTYTGKAITPEVIVANASEKLSADNYTVTYSNNTNSGTATAKVTLKGDYYEGGKSLTFTINKAANTMTVKAKKTVTVKYAKLKKKNQTVKIAKALTVANAQGPVTYKLKSVTKKKFKKYFKVAAKTGKITIKKKLKKGTYKIAVDVTCAGDPNYNPLKKTVKFKLKVK